MKQLASIRWRLTLWYGAMVALLLTIFAAGSILVLARGLTVREDRFLEESRGAFLTELIVEHHELGTVRPAAVAAVGDVKFSDTWMVVLDSTGQVIARGDLPSSINIGIDSMTRALASLGASGAKVTFSTLSGEEGGFRVALGQTRIGGEPLRVAAVQPRYSLVETIEEAATAYLIVIPLAFLSSGLVGYALARRALAPMAEMTRRTRAIGASNLHERLAASHHADEVAELAGVVNELLARVESALAQQRRFVADASHELRTPVAIIRAESDVALWIASRPEPEYRESLRVVGDVSRRLTRIVEDLFLLARADAGHLPLRPELLDLAELAHDIARAMRELAGARSVRVEVIGVHEAPFTGDAALIERLIVNLVDNAVKFSPPGGTVTVRIERQSTRWILDVLDDGPGVVEDQRERIFDRFFRAEPPVDDGRADSGAGLGLAIGRWIAEAHVGSLRHLPSSDNGSSRDTFRLELPPT